MNTTFRTRVSLYLISPCPQGEEGAGAAGTGPLRQREDGAGPTGQRGAGAQGTGASREGAAGAGTAGTG